MLSASLPFFFEDEEADEWLHVFEKAPRVLEGRGVAVRESSFELPRPEVPCVLCGFFVGFSIKGVDPNTFIGFSPFGFLGGGFIDFLFSSLFGEDSHFD